MIRERITLDGEWQFQYEGNKSRSVTNITPDRSILVPMPWQAQFDDLRERSGVGWYRRTLTIPGNWLEEEIFVRFGAVDYHADVWLNESYIGSHNGGYLPFEFSVTEFARPGNNSLTVRVSDPPADFVEIPHGKQSWYGPLSGIWQPVYLERRSALHLHHMRLLPDLETGKIELRLRLSQPAVRAMQVSAQVVGPEGEAVSGDRFDLPTGVDAVTHTVAVSEPLPWSPDTPRLYRIEVSLLRDEEAIDTLSDTFGFRTIEARDGRLYLNGEMLYLRGALDQDYYPETISTPPSLAFLEDQFRKAKELGLNCLRCHIKVPDPRYYDVADRQGMLIWTELPNWHSLTREAAERARETMRGIVMRDSNHPSIIIWTYVNEDWGTALMRDPTHRVWLRESYRWLKEFDPTRLVVDNSPCEGNFHLQTDIEDYHFYRAIPDHRLEWDYFVNAFAGRMAPTFSPFGDAVREGTEPLVVSEFGNWGLPDIRLLQDGEGQEPWWFETGLEWGEGVVYPHGVQQRFQRWGLDRVFGSWQAFVEATQWQQFSSLKYEIESIRCQPEIVGYVITEFTDVHWECNGLLDMRRNPKAFHRVFETVNTDTVLLPRWERVAYWAGETVDVGLHIAHGAGSVLPGGTARWRLSDGGSEGELSVPELAPGTSTLLGPITLQASGVDTPLVEGLTLTLSSDKEQHVASNSLPLTFFPRRDAGRYSDIRLWVAHPGFRRALRGLGYQLAGTPRDADAIVTDELDYAHASYVREGGRLLLLAQREDAIKGEFLGLQVQARQDTLWAGDWASSFAWLRRDGPFARFPDRPLLDFSFSTVMPDHVLVSLGSGLGPWDFESDVYAGLFIGWIHKVTALIVRRKFGAGSAVLSTFSINPLFLGGDPVATLLLDGLIELTLQS